MTVFNPQNLIEPTGRFLSRIPKAVPPQNYIRPFVRPDAGQVIFRILSRRILLLAAGLIGYEVGLRIRKPVRDFIKGLVDPSQPFNPELVPELVPTEFEIPFDPAIQFEIETTFGQNISDAGTFRCSDGAELSEPSSREPVIFKSYTGIYGFRYQTDVSVLKVACSGTGTAEPKLNLKVETADEEGVWTIRDERFVFDGLDIGDFYTAGSDVVYGVVTQASKDGQPLALPNPKVLPQVAPLPKVTPETLPSRVPEPEPKKAPPLPAPVPDIEPLPSTAPEPLPITIPSPVLPAVSPAVKPATEPTETTTTTQAGALTPKTPPAIVTTPKDVHLFGKNGARVAGSTMRATTTAVAQEVGRIEQKVSKMNTGFPSIGGLAELLFLLTSINDLLNSQKAGTTYELKSVCECPPGDDDCEEATTTVETEGGYYVDAILSRLDALPTLLQAQKDYKQPICNPKPTLLGDFRTLSFISDSKSEYGNDRLRKQFRYRSQSAIDLGGLVDHWKDFSWQAGPVCVQHKDAWWGTPQVWASSADEGKRVIRHAGSEAGINPDEEGKWIITGSSNSRYGQSGTMRICTKGGYYWITERLGSNNRPTVVLT